MTQKMIGVAVAGSRDSAEVLQRVEQVEAAGIPAVWLTTGGAGNDGLTLLAAAAARTQRVLMGTAIIPTWPRHPVAMAQQVQVIAGLAPGRFRLGVGPSHQAGMETIFGVDYRAPLGHPGEYLTILKALLHDGEVDFAGQFYQARARTGNPVDVLVDATLVRSILVPATMKLLGDRNWYLPRFLTWLPDFRVEGSPAIEPVGTGDD